MSKPIIPRTCFVQHAALQLRAAHPALSERLDKRIARAVQLIQQGAVSRGDERLTYHVRSASDPSQTYRVQYRPHAHTCTCPDYPLTHACKHLLAVYLVVQAQNLEWLFERAYYYYQAVANRNALAAKARLGVASEQELAHLVFMNHTLEPLGREQFQLYRHVLSISGLREWQQRVMRGGA